MSFRAENVALIVDHTPSRRQQIWAFFFERVEIDLHLLVNIVKNPKPASRLQCVLQFKHNTVHLRTSTVIFLICEATLEVPRGRKG
jgi:hypothetical protein